MAGRRTRRSPELSAAELRKIPIDTELSRPGTEVRILADGRVVWKPTFSKKFSTWPSREAFLEARAAAFNGGGAARRERLPRTTRGRLMRQPLAAILRCSWTNARTTPGVPSA